MPACRLTAGWVVSVEGPVIRNGAVLVGDDGRIVQVGPDDCVPAPPAVPRADFPAAVLLPGLINTHTHLELTGFEGQVEDDAFPDWIRRLRDLKETRSRDEYLAAARRGVADCWAQGVTTVADTGDRGVVIQALAELGGSGIAYQEVFGIHPDDCEPSMARLTAKLEELGRFASGRVRLGISPHAPYTVSGRLYRAAAELARAADLPVAVHLAESHAETRLLTAADGPFAEWWRARGFPLPPLPGRSPVAWLEEHGVLGPRTLCIHVVQVDGDDVERLRRAGVAIAHCPRANRRHGHGDAPLARFVAAGLRVGVGTDSVASVAPLDLLAEARTARAIGGLDAVAALALCTLGAARALGLDGEIGSLTPGKWGDVAVVAPPPRAADSAGDPVGGPLEAVLAAGPGHVVATYVAGREVFRRGR